uniref:PseI/NeuA/B-like domain-containing protein n=1 Tax=Seriola lalandi dorsalis TaxID=1841481 RepID=A0A3B4WN86_SERLL
MTRIDFKQPHVMAEIGCNHMGEFETAKELLTLAKEAGASVGKFQKRCPKELLTPEQYAAPHPNPRNAYGDTYGAHREYLELTVDQHRELKKHCEEIGLGYSCSVWDVTSAKEIVSLNPILIKVGSPSNQHWEMQKVLRDEYGGDIHISTGMTTKEEVEKIVTFWEEGAGDAKNRLVLYNCTSGYPVPFEDVCLLELRELYDKYHARVKAIGFSGHHLGIAVDVAAYAMGAQWNERHFTKDRTWKGTDHAASLEPAGLTKLCRDLQATWKCMTPKASEIFACGWRGPSVRGTLRGTRVGGVSPCPCTLCVDRRVCVGLVCATRLFLSPIGSKRPTALSRRVEIPVSMTRLSQ